MNSRCSAHPTGIPSERSKKVCCRRKESVCRIRPQVSVRRGLQDKSVGCLDVLRVTPHFYQCMHAVHCQPQKPRGHGWLSKHPLHFAFFTFFRESGAPVVRLTHTWGVLGFNGASGAAAAAPAASMACARPTAFFISAVKTHISLGRLTWKVNQDGLLLFE